jgi:general secretion pathway protein D
MIVQPLPKRLALCAVLALLGASLALAQSSARFTPSFKDADIMQIIEAVKMATGKNFIVDPRVRAQVTMLSSTPMTSEQFYQAFLAILSVHGFVAVQSGNIIKVLPDANMRQLPGNDLPDRVSASSDEMVTQVIAVKSVSAAQLVPVLRPLMPQNANLATVSGSNLMIISDRANNVNRLMRIIARIDQAGNSDIDVIPLQSATAADTVRVLNTLVGGTGGAADASGNPVKMVADDRSNSIFVSGDAAQRLRIKALITHLDTPLDSGSETQVRYLDYADAETLATKLKEQLSGTTSTAAATANTQNRVIPGQAPGQGQPANQPAAASAGATTISLAGGTAVIWADKDTNALVITAPQRTMRAVNGVIDKLDIRRAQVLVEAIIVEVNANRASDLGVNWLVDGSNSGVAAGGFVTPVGSNGTPPIVDLYGLVKGTSTTFPSSLIGTTVGIGRLSETGINFAAVLKALQTDARNNVIATPSIVTQDNQEAKIEVAKEVPFVTGQYTGTTGTSSAFQTIQREQVGTILTVTPQINKGDAVMLKISAESSSLDTSNTTGAVDLVTNKRTISTTVLINDGGTLVLGGLISDTSSNSESRVPGLGRIPIIGELFRSRSNSRAKTNLLVFIQPRILRTNDQAITETGQKYNFMREQQKSMNRETTILPMLPKERGGTLPELTTPPKPAPANGKATTGPDGTIGDTNAKGTAAEGKSP